MGIYHREIWWSSDSFEGVEAQGICHPMERERVTLSAGEQRRVMVLNHLEKGAVTLGEAAGLLGISERQVKRLRAEYRQEGPALDKAQREVANYKRFRGIVQEAVEVNEQICEIRPVSALGSDQPPAESGGKKGTLRRAPGGVPVRGRWPQLAGGKPVGRSFRPTLGGG